MSQWSNFGAFGEFAFSGEDSESEKIYNALTSALGPALTGPVAEAETYADAMSFGAARLQLQAAGAQDDPTQVSYLIEALEKDWRLFAGPVMTLADRRAALVAAMAASYGATNLAVVAGLTTILGTRLIGYRPMSETLGEISRNSVYPPHSPATNAPIRKIQFNTAISVGLQTVDYTRLIDDGNVIQTGDVLVVEPGRNGVEEYVTVLAASWLSFQAVFSRPHDIWTRATTGPFCRWTGNQRHSLIVVDSSVLTDSVALSKVHQFMRKTMPVVSTWAVCAETSPGYVGPFEVGAGLIGQTPIGVSSGETAILTEVP